VEVSDGELADSARWMTHVTEFYISEFSPDSTNLEIRRNRSVDFTHHVRAIEDLEFEYRWEHFGRGGNFEFEGEDSVRFDFELTGEHIIRALVTRGEEIESVEWDVNVRSIIWWWWPHELSISAPVDTTMEFAVFPFNEESDSLEYSWFINNEVLESDSSLIEIPFPEIGEYLITAYAQEGVEVDTIRWTVNVEELSFIMDEADQADLPTSPILYPASPNPFNSQTIISFYLPHNDRVHVTVNDLVGRQISELHSGMMSAGKHSLNWNADKFPSGLYIVSLETNNVRINQKVILTR